MYFTAVKGLSSPFPKCAGLHCNGRRSSMTGGFGFKCFVNVKTNERYILGMRLAYYISAALGCVCQVLPRDVLVIPLHLLPAVTRSVSRWKFTRRFERAVEIKGAARISFMLGEILFLPTLPSRIDADLSSRVSRSRKTD